MTAPAAPTPSIALLAFAMALNSMTTHLFTAGMPGAALDLGVSSQVIQLSLTLSLLGVAVAELVTGSLSDRFGRRPLALGGGVLFLLCCVVAAFSPGALVLIAARLFQALGSGAVRVCATASARDNLTSEQAARRFGILTVMQAISPMAALVIGGLSVAWFGWRSIFVFSAIMGALFLGCAMLWMRETNVQRKRGAGLVQMLADFAVLLRQRRFAGFAVGCAFNNGCFFGLVAAVPFILTGPLHQKPDDVGLYFALLLAANATGLLLVGRLLPRWGAARTAPVGSWSSVIGLVAFLGFSLSGTLTVTTLCLSLAIYNFGCGFLYPGALTGAIDVDPRRIGAAAGLFSFSIQIVGMASATLVGLWSHDLALGVGIIGVAMTAMGRLALLLTRRA